MGASRAGSYEVTPPGRSRAITPSAGPTDRPKDSTSRQAYGESDPAEDVSHILTGLREQSARVACRNIVALVVTMFCLVASCTALGPEAPSSECSIVKESVKRQPFRSTTTFNSAVVEVDGTRAAGALESRGRPAPSVPSTAAVAEPIGGGW